MKSMRASQKRKGKWTRESYKALGEKRVVGTMAIAKRMCSDELFLYIKKTLL
jgi:hypothetical protein